MLGVKRKKDNNNNNNKDNNNNNKNNINNENTYNNTNTTKSNTNTSEFKNIITNTNTNKEHQKFNSNKEKNKTKTPKKISTVSIAIPSSIIDNAQSKELRSYLVGQIARTCGVFRIDEIIIFHDSLNKGSNKDKLNFFITNLQYLETPQYLRKVLFPVSEDLKNCGLMNPLDASHHLRTNEYCDYREGVVINRPVKDNKGSWVNIGLRRDCLVEVDLPEKTRVTVELDEDCVDLHHETEIALSFNGNNNYINKKSKDDKNINKNTSTNNKKFYTGKLISSLVPKQHGIYWGYHVRLAETFEEVFDNSLFGKDKYDLIIGTSDKGKKYHKVDFPEYDHCLIVFGGLQGLEGVIDNEEHSGLKSSSLPDLFDYYLNTCPYQGSRTIRTEEALMITLSSLQTKLVQANK